jgi:hypothetical protein
MRQFHAETRERFTQLEAAIEPDGDEDEEEEEEDDDGGGGGGGEAEGGAELSQFGSIADVFHYFESRLDAAASEQERKEFEAAQHALESKVGTLMELNEELSEQNGILAQAYKELSEKTKTVVQFSTGADGSRQMAVKSSNGRKLTAFEQRVEALKAEGKTVADAMTFAVEEDTDRYQTHLQEKGAFAQQL